MKGLLVVCEGLDCSGKTTTINELLKNERFAYCKGIGSDSFIGRFSRKHPSTLVLFSELICNILFKIKPNLKQGNIILQDRYDISILSFPLANKWYNKVIGKLFRRLVIEPDAIVYFHLNLEERIERLREKRTKYENELASQEAEQLSQAGFSHGYKLRSSEETGRLQFFEKEGLARAVLALDTSDYTAFLPIVVYDRIKRDIEGKTIKKQVPIKKPQKVHREIVEGPFAKYVKEHFRARTIEGAFPYQDQEGEKDRFFEYLDHGIRPIILNGPTGNGKTVLSRDYACERGFPFYFDTGSTSFRLSTAIGKFIPSPGNPTFSPGSLTLAAVHGGVYVLEEMPPIPQDELTGLNIFLETGELPLITQFGHEVVTAHPNFRFVATGNFHSNYTTNELNDAFLQRFSQLKIGYPSRDNTVDILQARAPGLDYETAELITDVVEEMRPEARKFSKDLGLKGAVELAQRIRMGTDIPMRELIEDNIVNPLTTYENNIDRRDGKLYTKLMNIVDKYV